MPPRLSRPTKNLDDRAAKAAAALAAETDWQRERRRTAEATRQRRRLLPKAIAVGLFTGLVAVAFHLCLDLAEAFRNRLIDQAHHAGEPGFAALAAASALAVAAAAFLIRWLAPEAGGSGIPHLKAVLLEDRRIRWFRVLAAKFVGGLIGIGAGMALGREGPTVHMGAAVGEAVAELPGTEQEERRVLIAAAGGAGLAAAFNSPLAGLVFVLEELRGQLASLEFFAAAVACLAADMVCRGILGQYPVFRVTVAAAPDLGLVPAFVPLGIAAGFLGVAFNKALLAATARGAPAARFRLSWCLGVGAAVAGIGWFAPDLLGGGQRLLDTLLQGDGAGPPLLLFFGIRFLLTIASYSTGAAGGIFSPILVLGALLGLAVENLARLLAPDLPVEPHVFPVVGMAAYFTGVVRAPLTGIVLMIEMTGNYALILPLFVGCFSALVVADALGDRPIYEALLERDLRDRAGGRIGAAPAPRRW